MNHSRLLAALGAAGLLLTACGSSSDADKVKQALKSELTAVANGDGATACSLATPAAQAKLAQATGAGSCQASIAAVGKRLPPALKQGLLSAQINQVKISGDTAKVKDSDITTTQGTLQGFLMGGATTLKRQSDGSWKIAV